MRFQNTSPCGIGGFCSARDASSSTSSPSSVMWPNPYSRRIATSAPSSEPSRGSSSPFGDLRHGSAMNGRQPRSSVAASKVARRIFAFGARSTGSTDRMGSSSATGTSSVRVGAFDGSTSLSPCRPATPTPHGSPAAGSAITRFPPRSVHSRSARADSSESRDGTTAPLTHATVEKGAKPSQRSGNDSTSRRLAMAVVTFIEGIVETPFGTCA
ncbi:MAG: hypothetical protein LW636_09365 [Planctomycetaceae bacterium]|nr:hypothetical protein [Planctomycetaceae bacterium]